MFRPLFYVILIGFLTLACGPKTNDLAKDRPILAEIDLVDVINDRVRVTVNPGRFEKNQQAVFYLPKIVPGTYSNANYGRYIDHFKAFSYKGKPLKVSHPDENTWIIDNGYELDKVTYWVNDTYDKESTTADLIFSPAGTNIVKDKTFMLNLPGFLGYFKGLTENSWDLKIRRPQHLKPVTSLTLASSDKNNKDHLLDGDRFIANRYFDITDNPILYTTYTDTFLVDDITINLGIYTKRQNFSNENVKLALQETMKAQRNFLKGVKTTQNYTVMLYLADLLTNDATGFGALEHHKGTTVVLPESMPPDLLKQTLIDVVSHEFFHIITPLNLHSEEIHNFDYNQPEMSQHLWLYEGVTEYFANLFQINQGLIDVNDFYERLEKKIQMASVYDDQMSFTKMSKNILEEPYHKNYANVYQKGALIGMCIDLILREQSQGEKGILWLIKQLQNEYGPSVPFKDEALFEEIVSLSYPELGFFFNTHVKGDNPINYGLFLEKAGLEIETGQVETGFLLNGQEPFINATPAKNEIFFRPDIALNSFLADLGVKGEDILKSVNGQTYGLNNLKDLVEASILWQPQDPITMVVSRDGTEVVLEGTYHQPMVMDIKIKPLTNASVQQLKLREAWMKY